MGGKFWEFRRFRGYRTLGIRRSRGRKLAALLILIIILVAGIAYYADARTDSHLIQVYKELDKKDFDLQSMNGESREAVDGADKIYCGTQLEKARDYYAQLKEKGLLFKVNSIKYGTIKVLKYRGDSAVLLVESNYTGAFVNEGDTKEIAREMAVDNLCQVELAKAEGAWKIAEVVVLEEK